MLTTEKLKKLREVAEDGAKRTYAPGFFPIFLNPETVLDLLDEIERLRKLEEKYNFVVNFVNNNVLTPKNQTIAMKYIEAVEEQKRVDYVLRLQRERYEARVQVAVMKDLLEEMLPGVMHYSHSYNNHPKADSSWDGYDWDEFVRRIQQTLFTYDLNKALAELEKGE